MQIKLGISFEPRWAYVDSVYYTQTDMKTELKLLEHSLACWRDFATLRFCFHGKPINVKVGDMLSVESDKLDEEFFKLAKHVSAYDHKFWKQIYDMLEGGKERGEVLDYLRAYAIARGLNGKPLRKR
jgi:hypothetical protein